MKAEDSSRSHSRPTPVEGSRSSAAELLKRLGRTAQATHSYERTLGLTRQEPRRRFIELRLKELRR